MTKLWWAQIQSVIRLEMKKTLFARRGLWIYVLALLPLVLFAINAAVVSRDRHRSGSIASEETKKLTYQDLTSVKPDMTSEEVIALLGRPPLRFKWKEQKRSDSGEVTVVPHDQYHYSDGAHDMYVELVDDKVVSIQIGAGFSLPDATKVFAGVFQFFYLRLAIFFGCLGVFMNLFRGEVLDKSLHFYFLAPIRREVLMAGKFLAGLLATCIIFVTSEVLQILVFTSQFSPNARDLYLYQNHGLAQAAAYVGLTALACLGYGAFSLAAGILVRNPIFPAASILIWESVNPFLPGLLQKFSVIYYLKSLCPVDIPTPPGTPALLALLVSNPDPVSAPVAILGVVGVSLFALYVSSVQVRHMEINYTTE
jgi:ABC-type transport system involved in multi-copper enzyme maturation permease subunit